MKVQVHSDGVSRQRELFKIWFKRIKSGNLEHVETGPRIKKFRVGRVIEPEGFDATHLADKRMQDIDIEDSRLNGEIFFAALKPLAPRAAWKSLKTDCFLMMQLTGAAVRLAVALDRKEGDRIIDAYKGMLLSKLMQNLES